MIKIETQFDSIYQLKHIICITFFCGNAIQIILTWVYYGSQL